MSQANPYSSPEFGGKDTMNYGHLASRMDRFLAALIDCLIAIPFSCLVSFVIGIFLSMLGDLGQIVLTLVSSAMNVAGGLGLYLVIHGYLLSTRGQTVGKMMMKIQIVGEDGNMLPFGTLLLKRILPIWGIALVPCVGFVVVIADMLMIFRENRKCLHDDFASTKVIKLAA